jgi:hypothetical protein
MNERSCSLCNPNDYDSDWGGKRWICGFQTKCPECSRRFSGHIDVPILSDPHPFLKERLKRRNSMWLKLKRLFNIYE